MKRCALAAATLWVFACSPATDIGQLCVLDNPDGGAGLWTETSSTNSLLYAGTASCQDAFCLRPAGSGLDAGIGYCSALCTPEDPSAPSSPSSDCSGSVIPTTCSTVGFDSDWINGILAADGGRDLLEEDFGTTGVPSFCTPTAAP